MKNLYNSTKEVSDKISAAISNVTARHVYFNFSTQLLIHTM